MFNLIRHNTKKVLIRAPLLTISGYGVHSRQLYQWATSRPDFDVYTQVLNWGMTPWLLNSDDKNGLVGDIMKRTINPSNTQNFDISFQIQLPNEWDPNIAKFNVGVTAAVETDRCSRLWIDSCNKMDLIVVPSQHTRDVLVTSFPGELNVPIVIIPEAYHTSIDDPSLEPLNLDLTTSFNFLVFGQLTGNNPENDRKNLFYTLKWMCEEFKDDSDVGIIVKTNSGKSTKIDRDVTRRVLSQLTKQVKGNKKYPKIYLLHGNMSDEEVASLYKNTTVKATVSLTRGEGFGLPLLEAAASGMPVITTNWSGHTDFMNLGKYISIDTILTPVHQSRVDGKIFVEGSKWASVNETEVKSKLRKFYEKPFTPSQWAKELRTVICKKYNLGSVIDTYNEVLKDYIK